MIVDMLRSCYSTEMSFFVDDPITIPVQWYFCDEDALPFPGYNRFGSGNWASSRDSWPGIGEVLGAPRPWNNGLMPRLLNEMVDSDIPQDDRHLIIDASQDNKGFITLTLDTVGGTAPVDIQPGQRMYVTDITGGWTVEGPFHVHEVLNGEQVTIFWPRPMRPFPVGHFVFLYPLAVWGEFKGQHFKGTLDQFANGCTYDATANYQTNEQGLCLDCMPLPAQCWLTVLDVRDPVPTGVVAGQVIVFDLAQALPDEYLIIEWDSTLTYSGNPFYSWKPYFAQLLDGLGLNSGFQGPSIGPNQFPDGYTIDQRTFWWLDFDAVSPAGEPTIHNERWTCVLTFDDPAEFPPGPIYPMFPPGYFPSGYWPPAFGF
jgi:hypothetical protein